jgi:inositol phosphorylceramide synthase catalytic subunit
MQSFPYQRDRWPWIMTAISAFHLVFAATTMGLRTEHIVVDVLMAALAWTGPRGSEFTKLALPIWLVGALYDSFRLVTQFRATIRVDELYLAELRWFGITVDGHREILSDFFRDHHVVVFDLLCGFAYIFYLIEPLLIVTYLSWRKRERARQLAWAFLAANVLALTTYLVYPAAPPWYVEQYGLGPARVDAPPSPAGAANFDELTGIPLFHQFYSRSPNVFGAMPSMHAAYPVMAMLAVAGLGVGWLVATGMFALLVAFAAVYLRHHYVWDVMVGWSYACIAFAVVGFVLRKRSTAAGPKATPIVPSSAWAATSPPSD